MGTSQRQAAKARRWQDLHKDVLILDSHLHSRKFRDLSSERDALDTSIASLRSTQSEAEDRIRDEEADVAAERADLREMESLLTSLRHQLNERQNLIHSAENRIGFNSERERELSSLIDRNEHDIAASNERLSYQEEELRSTDSALSAITENLVRQKSQIEEHFRIAAATREDRLRIESSLREARKAMHLAESTIASAQAAISSHQSQGETDRFRQDQLQRDSDSLTSDRESRLTDESGLKESIESLKDEIESLELALHQREKEAQTADIEAAQLNKKLQELTRFHSERSSRAGVLRQLIAAGEGLEKGTRKVLAGLNQPDHFKAGVRGLLSSFIEVERQYIPAVEAALGENLQAVLVSDSLLAESIIETLRRDQLGQALVLPEDLLRTTGEYQMLTPPEGGLAWAADVVSARESVRPMVHQLLANVLIVPDVATALRLKRENPEIVFATLHGEFISIEGVVSGGTEADRAGSMLQRQTELADLDAEVATLEANLNAADAELIARQNDARSARIALDEQREILQARRVQESQLSGQLSLVSRDLQALSSKLESLDWERSELAKRQDAVALKLEDASARLADASDALQSHRDEAASHEAAMDAASRNEADANELLGELKTALAVEQRAEQALREQRSPMDARLRELLDVIQRREHEIITYKERIANADAENARLHEEIAASRSLVAELADQIESRSEERTSRSASLAERERALDSTRRQIHALAEQRGREEVRVTKVSLRMESLHTYASERYQIDLTSFEPTLPALVATIATLKAARSRPSSRRQNPNARSSSDDEPDADDEAIAEAALAAAGFKDSQSGSPSPDTESDSDSTSPAEDLAAEIDWDFVESSVTDLKQRLDSMGPVNLDAIKEFEELEERHNFLQRENDDLANAKSELLGIIQRINDETKKRFVETFIKVRDNFRGTFKELFGQGGQADLILVNENDPLESGIEVIAKPPGKKPTSISLLSGGERSMTAVALLFSIYMVKPSPFCILDELDAPLDESNIGRFLKMLDKFIEKSQFVIVTHNKRTMRRADVMYGVTMEEFGVSKPIGMKMSGDDSDARRRRASAGDHEAPISELPADMLPDPPTSPEASETPESSEVSEPAETQDTPESQDTPDTPQSSESSEIQDTPESSESPDTPAPSTTPSPD
jgi:chromosome segregation protein